METTWSMQNQHTFSLSTFFNHCESIDGATNQRYIWWCSSVRAIFFVGIKSVWAIPACLKRRHHFKPRKWMGWFCSNHIQPFGRLARDPTCLPNSGDSLPPSHVIQLIIACSQRYTVPIVLSCLDPQRSWFWVIIPVARASCLAITIAGYIVSSPIFADASLVLPCLDSQCFICLAFCLQDSLAKRLAGYVFLHHNITSLKNRL